MRKDEMKINPNDGNKTFILCLLSKLVVKSDPLKTTRKKNIQQIDL